MKRLVLYVMRMSLRPRPSMYAEFAWGLDTIQAACSLAISNATAKASEMACF